jgi:hypothetical protein
MKEQTIKYLCDDCGSLTPPHKIAHVDDSGKPCLDGAGMDICFACLDERIQHSVSLTPIGRQCKTCSGTGKTKEYYGHNEYDYKDCVDCGGIGYIKLTHKT